MKKYIEEDESNYEESEEESNQSVDKREEDFKKYGFGEEDEKPEEGTEEASFENEEQEESEVPQGEDELEQQKKIEENYLTSDYQPIKEVSIPYNKLYNFKDYDVFEGKFGNIARIQFSCFNADEYEPENPIILTDEKGHKVEKIFPYDKFIRWKYSNENKQLSNEDDTEKELLHLFNLENLQDKPIQSNARIIEWSDGSHQLLIGSEFFDINVNKVSNTRLGINCDNEHALLLGDSIRNKMIIKRNIKFDSKATKRRESYSYEDLRPLKELIKEDTKVKTFHSYYNKNKFTREEYMSKSGKISESLIKKVKRKEEEQLQALNQGNQVLNKKRQIDS